MKWCCWDFSCQSPILPHWQPKAAVSPCTLLGVLGRAVTRTRCSEAPVSHGALTLADPQHPAAEAAHQQTAGNPQQVSLAHFYLKILPLCWTKMLWKTNATSRRATLRSPSFAVSFIGGTGLLQFVFYKVFSSFFFGALENFISYFWVQCGRAARLLNLVVCGNATKGAFQSGCW